MKIHLTSIFVDDQDRAERFYRDILGFRIKSDVPLGTHRWLTVVSADQPEGPDLLLEPSDHPAVPPYKQALVADGIPAHSFQVEDLDATRRELGERGVVFTQEPVSAGPVRVAVFDDTCGNLIQLVQMLEADGAA